MFQHWLNWVLMSVFPWPSTCACPGLLDQRNLTPCPSDHPDSALLAAQACLLNPLSVFHIFAATKILTWPPGAVYICLLEIVSSPCFWDHVSPPSHTPPAHPPLTLGWSLTWRQLLPSAPLIGSLYSSCLQWWISQGSVISNTCFSSHTLLPRGLCRSHHLTWLSKENTQASWLLSFSPLWCQ